MEMAAAFVYEKPGDSRDSFAFSVPFLNVLLIECLNAENSNREPEQRLDAAPMLTSPEDDVPYCEKLTRGALPYGLAARYYAAEDDAYNENLMQQRYYSGIQAAHMMQEVEIEDVY